jgi:hypothetical protein
LGAKVVVAAHPTDFIVMEDAMTIAIILSVAGLGFLCWLASTWPSTLSPSSSASRQAFSPTTPVRVRSARLRSA